MLRKWYYGQQEDVEMDDIFRSEQRKPLVANNVFILYERKWTEESQRHENCGNPMIYQSIKMKEVSVKTLNWEQWWPFTQAMEDEVKRANIENQRKCIIRYVDILPVLPSVVNQWVDGLW